MLSTRKDLHHMCMADGRQPASRPRYRPAGFCVCQVLFTTFSPAPPMGDPRKNCAAPHTAIPTVVGGLRLWSKHSRLDKSSEISRARIPRMIRFHSRSLVLLGIC